MRINDLLKVLNINETFSDFDVKNLAFDSRAKLEDGVFVCLVGSETDGHDYVDAAIKNGVKLIVAQKDIEASVPVLKVENTRKALALLSAEFFGRPFEKIKTIGITGTKGKTTTAFMIKSVLESAGHKVGMIGTVGVITDKEIIKINNTTPESYYVQKYMSEMLENECEYCVMEVSSIGLKDFRVYGFDFDCAVFTNFSRDHIGGVEHTDMKEYFDSKAKLFSMCKNAVINLDDDKSEEIINSCKSDYITFGFNGKCDIKAIENHLVSEGDFIGSYLKTEGIVDLEADIAIPGKFNAYNSLAAISVAYILGVDNESMKNGLKSVKVKGRLEPVSVSDKFTVLLDYAHNAVSMENVLTTLREYKPNRLICLFGAGGNRPKIRRYEMGETSGNLADLSIITEDNSRFEDVSDIIEDIKVGMSKTNGDFIVIPDRKEAMKYCIESGQKGDVFVFAGKGHEDYQEIKGVKYPFDERVVIKEILEELN